jgi:hypothetical protein
MSVQRDNFKRLGEEAKIGLALSHAAALSPATGEVFIEVVDVSTGEVLHKEHRKNVITLDAGVLVAILLRDPDSRDHGFNMLSVGTGATGPLLSPDAPDPRQRSLNAEIARKPWSSTTFRDSNGDAVAIPTNIVDYTCTFDEGEAVGPLNEMGIQSTISANPAITNPNPDVFPNRDVTRDLAVYDILGNYLSFSVISKPNTARLTITWRITC